MARRNGIALIMAALLLLSWGQGFAQESTLEATPEAAPDMTAYVWELVEMQTGPDSSAAPDDPTRYTVRFFDDGVAAVIADCNAGRGSYTVDGSSIDIAIDTMTMAPCPEGALADQFVADLEQVATFVFNEAGELVLWLPADAGFLRFQPSLTGVVWQWTGLESSDGSTVTPDDPSRYTIEFLPAQEVVVGADCNRGSGTYTRTLSELELNVEALTQDMCAPGSLSDDFIAYLNDVVTVTFVDGQIHLAMPRNSGILTFSPQPFIQAEPAGTPEA